MKQLWTSCSKDLLSARFLSIAAMVVIAAAFRILPHPSNFSPIAAMALFAGAQLGRKWLAFALPLAAMLLSDAVLGFHNQMPAVYGSVALISLLGTLLADRKDGLRIGVGTLAGSVLFFVITNFAFWAQGEWYPRTFAGLVSCFTLALPFFQNTLMGDMFYSTVLFGGFALATRAVPQLR